jgi:PTS system nitrogen regulatory IIA component
MIYRWIEEGGIPVHTIRDQYRFSRAELLEWGTAQGLNLSPQLLEEHERAGSVMPAIADALARGGIHYKVPGDTRDSTLRSVVSLLPLPDEVDREYLTDVLLAREALGSTGIGDGIAMPHVRSPIVLHVEEPIVALCYLENEVDFGAIDGKPVRILFILVTPTVRTHLHLLARLAFLLREHHFREAVLAEQPPESLQALARDLEASIGRKSHKAGS